MSSGFQETVQLVECAGRAGTATIDSDVDDAFVKDVAEVFAVEFGD